MHQRRARSVLKVFVPGILLFLPVWMFCCPLGSWAQDASEALVHAAELMAGEKYLEAERVLIRALGAHPGKAALYVELGNVYAALYDQARKKRLRSKAGSLLEKLTAALNRAVMLEPENLAARFNLGVALKRSGRFEDAREEFRKVEKLAAASGDDPSRIRAFLQIGATYEEQGFFGEASDYYRRAQELDYGNTGIRSAIEDTDIRRREREERAGLERAKASSLPGWRGRFPYSPDSQAAGLQEAVGEDSQGRAGLQGVVPYLGAMLYEQFMRIRSGDE